MVQNGVVFDLTLAPHGGIGILLEEECHTYIFTGVSGIFIVTKKI